MSTNEKQYHVALSYAGEQREYVAKVAYHLKSQNVRCFYDKDEEIKLWGKDILQFLQEIFEDGKTYFVVVFISQEYVDKIFPRVELRYALSEYIQREQEYILLARFDSVKVPALPTTLKYIALKDKNPGDFSQMIIQKLIEKGIYLGPDTETTEPEIQRVSRKDDSQVILTVKDEFENPVSGVDAYLIHENGTHRSNQSNTDGKVFFSLNRNNKKFYTIFLAHSAFLASIVNNFRGNKDIEVTMKKKTGIGSIIFPNGTGHIPGIDGRLNPILDTSKRTYIYANNISVNNGLSQPTRFKFGENISLVDSLEKAADIRIHRIIQQCIILDYIVH